MCEILLKFVDTHDSTHADYALSYLAGDIITVCPDGWVWTGLELTDPRWRVIKIPDVNPSVVNVALNPRVDPITGSVRRKRDYKIDMSLIPSAVYTYLSNHQVVTLTPTQASTVANWIRQHSIDLTQS